MTVIKGKHVEINDKVFVTPEGYPNFGFWYDKDSGRYAIANIETKEITEPFVDGVIYSEVPLETWTANYVVVRIKDKYYLADNNGDCRYESDEPFIICRNVFVSGDKRYVINNNLIRVFPDDNMNIVVEKIGSYNFAFSIYKEEVVARYVELPNDYEKVSENVDVNIHLYSADGKIREFKKSSCKLVSIVFDRLDNWCVELKYLDRYNDIDERIAFLNKSFEIITIEITEDFLTPVGIRSNTYSNDYTFVSIYFAARVQFRKYGDLEVVVHDGKTYFFKAEGEIEEVDTIISEPQIMGKYIVYREHTRIVKRDFEGNVIAVDELSPKEAYEIVLQEKLLERDELRSIGGLLS